MKAVSKWWVVLDTCNELSRLFRERWNWEYRFTNNKLLRPSWDSHVTVVRDERPQYEQFWDRHAGRDIGFEYDNRILGTGEYFWVEVYSEALHDLREELGLARMPEIPFHISIGKR